MTDRRPRALLSAEQFAEVTRVGTDEEAVRVMLRVVDGW